MQRYQFFLTSSLIGPWATRATRLAGLIILSEQLHMHVMSTPIGLSCKQSQNAGGRRAAGGKWTCGTVCQDRMPGPQHTPCTRFCCSSRHLYSMRISCSRRTRYRNRQSPKHLAFLLRTWRRLCCGACRCNDVSSHSMNPTASARQIVRASLHLLAH